jgi:ADP-ribose pyrophosphatase YjhB (NUDIX family)
MSITGVSNSSLTRALAVVALLLPAADCVLSAAAEEHALPPQATEVACVFGFPITNSMVASWMVAVALIVFARRATRQMQHVSSGRQRAQARLAGKIESEEVATVNAMLARSLVQLKVKRRRRT